MPEANPQQAHEHLKAAVEFIDQAQVPLDYYRQGERINRSHEEGDVNFANLNLEPGDGPHGGPNEVKLSLDDDKTGYALTWQDVQQGTYESDLSMLENGAIQASATVERDGMSHTFKAENAEKAATLLTELAAKRLGKRATSHVNQVVTAQEAFNKKVNK